MLNTLDTQYVQLLQKIRDTGTWEPNRTGIDAKTIVGAMLQHDMTEGFPLLTIKQHPFKSIKVELEGFINGITSKAWYNERGCTIWNEWCNPQKVPYGIDKATQDAMAAEDDLGPIYGFQWRNFGAHYYNDSNQDHAYQGIDQLVELIKLLNKDKSNRRAIVSAWNPSRQHQMALPPCHYAFQVTIVNNKLHLLWNQRSVDTPLGLPFNIASYGLLLHLLAKELKVAEGTLTGFLANVHYYRNQEDAVNQIIERKYKEIRMLDQIEDNDTYLPTIETNFSSIFTWDHSKTKLIGYNPLPKIEIPIAI